MRTLTKAIIVAAGFLTACGDSDAPCTIGFACVLSTALRLTVTSATSGAPITAASVAVSGAQTGNISCNGTCDVEGSAGTYTITVSAPGFTSVQRSVHVTGTTPKCGCPRAHTQQLALALLPA